MSHRLTGFLLVAPALAIVLLLFIVPLFGAITGAFDVSGE
ncbi:sugar ABC transporter permease, partial [Brucella intermedia]